jgi:chromosome partitioning protein
VPFGGAAGLHPYRIILGNEKGGTGKSTSAVHLVMALLRLGFRVGKLDLDRRQGTLSRTSSHESAGAACNALLAALGVVQDETAAEPARAEAS